MRHSNIYNSVYVVVAKWLMKSVFVLGRRARAKSCFADPLF